ncbi:hypothetical protein ACFL3T_02415 [Patescibacteria group bacterium]
MRDFYLFNNGWGIFLTLLVPIFVFRVTLVRAWRDLEGWEILKSSLIVLGAWFVLGFFPGNLVWVYDFFTWLDYDIVFIVGLVAGLSLMIYYRTRPRVRESEELIFGSAAAISFLYILCRVAYLYASNKGEGLLSLLV